MASNEERAKHDFSRRLGPPPDSPIERVVPIIHRGLLREHSGTTTDTASGGTRAPSAQQQAAVEAVLRAQKRMQAFLDADTDELESQTWDAEYEALAYALMDRIADAHRSRVRIRIHTTMRAQ